MKLGYKSLFVMLVLSLIVLPAWAQDEGISPDDAEIIGGVEDKVAELRGLVPMEAVARDLWTPDEVAEWLSAELDAIYTPEDARDDVIFYNVFDFMPLQTDLRQLQLDLMSEQIGGFYDIEGEQMVIVDFGNGFDALSEITYAHEFTHALQDQYFDLDALGLGAETAPDMSADMALARRALVEGDATQLMREYMIWRVQEEDGALFSLMLFGSLDDVNMAQLEGAPLVLNAELMFPYLSGLAFVQDVLYRGGWVLLDAVYERPPLSTEQILHPQQYFDADEPQLVDVTLPDALLGAEWRLVDQDVLGEFYLREYLAQHLPVDEANLAAEGWGGDRFVIYHDDDTGASVLLYRVVWDAISHEREFIDAFVHFASARYGDAAPVVEDEGLVCWEGDVYAGADAGAGEMGRHDATCLYYAGNDTLLVQGPDMDIVRALGDLQGLGE